MTTGKPDIVMDTNVAVVANGQTPQANPNCRLKCIDKLRQVQDEFRVLLDDKNLIFEEYKERLSFSGQPGPGDAFFKWLFENQANPEHCRRVTVTLHPEREFLEFPDDPALASFDRNDRKFVAVVLASETCPKILNASDTDWWHQRRELEQQGVEVVFICPELMRERR